MDEGRHNAVKAQDGGDEKRSAPECGLELGHKKILAGGFAIRRQYSPLQKSAITT